MSEDNALAPTGSTNSPADASTAKVIYILYLVSTLTVITSIVGVILAYTNKAQAPLWVQSHYQFQIRTFWIGALYVFIGSLTTIVLVGWLMLLFVLVWLVMRCVKGMALAEKGEAVDNVQTWMFP